MTSTQRILVTAALPYANGPIHIGHLVEYIQADIFVRFLKLVGKDAIYVCADDSHGTSIEINAEKEGVNPEEFVEKWHKEHIRDFKSFLIDFDSYSLTNSPENKRFSDYFFNELNNKGLIYKKTIKITYCEKCKRPLPDRFVKGRCPQCGAEEQYGDVCEKCGATYSATELINARCVICSESPVLKDSEHYFFKLSAFSDRLKRWLVGNKKLQPGIRNYVLNWIKSGLRDWDISRDGPYFGFKIPDEENKYYYVWFDAPICYIASTANYCKRHKLDALADYWKNDKCSIIHVIGKDIVYFHFLFWPAMLIGVEFNLPDYEVVHGMLTVNKEKMSKSRGTFFTAKDFLKRYPNPEYLRFYYAGLLSKKMADIDLDLNDFENKVNNELVANLSNFCYRTMSFVNKNFDSRITDFNTKEMVITQINEKINDIKESYANFDFKKALSRILAISSLGNSYFQKNEPWKLFKKDKEKAQQVLTLCINIAKNLAIVCQPILPQFSANLERQLNLKGLRWADLGFNLVNHRIAKAEMLVKKLEK